MGVGLLLAWGSLSLRAAHHYRTGRAAEEAGHLAEAGREYETAVGCCAPFNPYCRAAAERMWELSRSVSVSAPALSEELRDRLLRVLRSSRWLLQPHSSLLQTVQSYGPPRPPQDPRGGLFLLSCLALTLGLGAWWLPRPLPLRACLGLAGLGGWAALLYLC